MIYWYLLFLSFTRNITTAVNNLAAPVTAAPILLCSVFIFPVLKMIDLYVFKTVYRSSHRRCSFRKGVLKNF